MSETPSTPPPSEPLTAEDLQALLADAEARITGHITCSARMAIGEAGYARVR